MGDEEELNYFSKGDFEEGEGHGEFREEQDVSNTGYELQYYDDEQTETRDLVAAVGEGGEGMAVVVAALLKQQAAVSDAAVYEDKNDAQKHDRDDTQQRDREEREVEDADLKSRNLRNGDGGAAEADGLSEGDKEQQQHDQRRSSKDVMNKPDGEGPLLLENDKKALLYHGDVVNFKEMRFQAHVASVENTDHVKQFVKDSGQAATRTFNRGRGRSNHVAEVTAFTFVYRLTEGTDTTGRIFGKEGYSDGGDVGAGQKLLDLLRKWNLKNVALAVSRIDSGLMMMMTELAGVSRYKVMMDRAKKALEATYLQQLHDDVSENIARLTCQRRPNRNKNMFNRMVLAAAAAENKPAEEGKKGGGRRQYITNSTENGGAAPVVTNKILLSGESMLPQGYQTSFMGSKGAGVKAGRVNHFLEDRVAVLRGPAAGSSTDRGSGSATDRTGNADEDRTSGRSSNVIGKQQQNSKKPLHPCTADFASEDPAECKGVSLENHNLRFSPSSLSKADWLREHIAKSRTRKKTPPQSPYHVDYHSQSPCCYHNTVLLNSPAKVVLQATSPNLRTCGNYSRVGNGGSAGGGDGGDGGDDGNRGGGSRERAKIVAVPSSPILGPRKSVLREPVTKTHHRRKRKTGRMEGLSSPPRPTQWSREDVNETGHDNRAHDEEKDGRGHAADDDNNSSAFVFSVQAPDLLPAEVRQLIYRGKAMRASGGTPCTTNTTTSTQQLLKGPERTGQGVNAGYSAYATDVTAAGFDGQGGIIITPTEKNREDALLVLRCCLVLLTHSVDGFRGSWEDCCKVIYEGFNVDGIGGPRGSARRGGGGEALSVQEALETAVFGRKDVELILAVKRTLQMSNLDELSLFKAFRAAGLILGWIWRVVDQSYLTLSAAVNLQERRSQGREDRVVPGINGHNGPTKVAVDISDSMLAGASAGVMDGGLPYIPGNKGTFFGDWLTHLGSAVS